MSDIKNFNDLLNSPQWQEMQDNYERGAKQYESRCEEYWNSLSNDDRLKAFYSVCKRIHQGELKDKGSYRWVLYDVFGFDPTAYVIGMECGYMAIHNAIVDIDEFEALRKENIELKNKLATAK